MSHMTRTTRLTLPNGLILLVGENHSNPTISIQGLVKAGALYDNADAAAPVIRSPAMILLSLMTYLLNDFHF